ncbi:GGDEF domain-containing protein, partial [Pseudoduganella sp. FT9W]|nr:GGDEF domain-containing protein [Duganella alba]
MDIKTLLLALALGNLSLCAALFFFAAGARRAGQGAHGRGAHATWARAKQCQALAWCLLYFRGDLPDLLTIPIANAVLFAGFALDAAALWEQAGRRIWRPYLVPALGAAIGVYVAAWLLQLPAGGRIAIGAAASALF